MNRNSLLLTFILTLSFILSVNADNKCGEDCQWSIQNNILTITGSGKMQNYFSDSEIHWRDSSKTVTQITIDGITYIGQKAFQNMPALKTVEMNGVDEIGEGAFYNTGLESITIPKSVKKIDRNAFEQSSVLKTVTFEANSQLNEIEESAFKNCPKIESITLPDSLEIIKDHVFEGCSNLHTISFGTPILLQSLQLHLSSRRF